MRIKDKLNEMHLLLFAKMMPYMLHEYWMFSKHVARCNMSKNSNKLLTDILMTTHAIEKGFSLDNKRKGFGVKKIVGLTRNVEKYIRKYGYTDKLDTPVALVNSYLVFQENDGFKDKALDKVSASLKEIIRQNAISMGILNNAGALVKTKEQMLEDTHVDFAKLANNRYSFRHFSNEEVSEDMLRKALDIAKKTPSACNRQAYRVHVFSGKDKDAILKLQGGANSFYTEANKAVLITADMNRYYTKEMHLPYVDGSLFAMTFIYALTSLGIASIPLTMGQKLEVIKKMSAEMDIPANEVPVLLIAIGQYPDKAEVSLSHRNEVDTFTTFH